MGHLSETEPAQPKITIECPSASAIPASIPETGGEFLRLSHFYNG